MHADKEIIFSITAIVCAFSLSSTSIAIPFWLTTEITVDNVPVYSYAGLWKDCAEALGDTECILFTDVKDFVNATRGLLIVGTVMVGLSLLLVVKYAANRSTESLANMRIITLLLGVILVITAMIVFASNTTDSGLTYGSAFYLTLPSSVSSIIAAYVVFRAKKSHVSHGYSPIGFESARTSV
ncbi:uncharacterized protein LOC132725561 [Ruditapes philippinarum]|uniref:uncharacterized protein LOC132725561 n=1 Tax=Ruditapes philippinarum TaxID=129788 RepID=UPI00295C0626|nr:uncharacterized protein LOC132725561 [Ruditapes philippinarum]XP_060566690.1 uncharacterized protein LOC132725561 [Ruditapes philippinarum]